MPTRKTLVPSPLTLPRTRTIIPIPIYVTVCDNMTHPVATADIAGRYTIVLRRGTRLPDIWDDLTGPHHQAPLGALYTWATIGGIDPFAIYVTPEVREFLAQPAEPDLVPPPLRIPRQHPGQPFRHRALLLPPPWSAAS